MASEAGIHSVFLSGGSLAMEALALLASFLFMVVCVSCASGEEMEHPVPFFRKGEIKQFKRKLEHPFLKQKWDEIIAQCNEALHQPLPEAPHFGTRGKRWHIRLRNTIGLVEQLALAYRVTGKEEYARKARSLLLRMCEDHQTKIDAGS